VELGAAPRRHGSGAAWRCREARGRRPVSASSIVGDRVPRSGTELPEFLSSGSSRCRGRRSGTWTSPSAAAVFPRSRCAPNLRNLVPGPETASAGQRNAAPARPERPECELMPFRPEGWGNMATLPEHARPELKARNTGPQAGTGSRKFTVSASCRQDPWRRPRRRGSVPACRRHPPPSAGTCPRV
jgi:hypothetical protein